MYTPSGGQNQGAEIEGSGTVRAAFSCAAGIIGHMNVLIAATLYIVLLTCLVIAVWATNTLADHNWRFGLRALLIAAALISVVLWFVVWAVRK
jgi:hypothetical protein